MDQEWNAHINSSSLQNSKNLTTNQIALLKEIQDQFEPGVDDADLRILYEVTGYQGERDDDQFWLNYTDFEELGDTQLVRNDKNEKAIKARQSIRKSLKNMVTFAPDSEDEDEEDNKTDQ